MKFAHTLSLIILASLSSLAPAEETSKPKLFSSHDMMHLTLEAPFKTMYRKRDKTLVHPATLRYDSNGQPASLPLELQLRGNFRLDSDNCSKPPLRFLFNKKASKGTPFAKLERVKFVQPCKDKSHYKELVLKEYLAYRLYNEVTDLSYRVRLVSIDLVDTDRNQTINTLGFFIEPNKRLSKRIDKDRLKIQKVRISQADNLAMAQLNLFQYMIANTDYSALTAKKGEECCHNVRIFQAKGDRYITPIPYDFDFSGFVNAPYAKPSIPNTIKNVRQRRYRGLCEQNDELRRQAKVFYNKRNTFNGLINELELAKPQTLERAVAYLEKFYSVVGDPKLVEKRLVKFCR